MLDDSGNTDSKRTVFYEPHPVLSSGTTVFLAYSGVNPKHSYRVSHSEVVLSGMAQTLLIIKNK